MTDNPEDESEKESTEVCENILKNKYSDEQFFDFIAKEKEDLKAEINQLKQGQIVFLTANVSAVALLFIFLFNFYFTLDEGFYEFLMILPILIIFPSIIILLHKSYEINEKTSYIQLINDKILTRTVFNKYLGYENYKPNFDFKWINIGTSKKFFQILVGLFNLIAAKKGNRFLSMLFYLYFGLLVINITVPMYFICQNNPLKSFFSYSTLIIILIAIIVILPYLIGKSSGKTQKYWRRFGNITYFLFFIVPTIIFPLLLILLVLLLTFIPDLILPHFKNIDINTICQISDILVEILPSYQTIIIIIMLFFAAIFIGAKFSKKEGLDVIIEKKCEIFASILCLTINILLAMFLFFSLNSDKCENLRGLVTYVTIIFSVSLTVYIFSEIWNLRYGNKSLCILKSNWEEFISNITPESQNKEEIICENIKYKSQEEKYIETNGLIDLKEKN